MTDTKGTFPNSVHIHFNNPKLQFFSGTWHMGNYEKISQMESDPWNPGDPKFQPK